MKVYKVLQTWPEAEGFVTLQGLYSELQDARDRCDVLNEDWEGIAWIEEDDMGDYGPVPMPGGESE